MKVSILEIPGGYVIYLHLEDGRAVVVQLLDWMQERMKRMIPENRLAVYPCGDIKAYLNQEREAGSNIEIHMMGTAAGIVLTTGDHKHRSMPIPWEMITRRPAKVCDLV
jgi:hypothetical protein